jgi:hypothetical protein
LEREGGSLCSSLEYYEFCPAEAGLYISGAVKFTSRGKSRKAGERALRYHFPKYFFETPDDMPENVCR